MAEKSFFGRSNEEKRGNPMLGEGGMPGLLSGYMPGAKPAAKKPAKEKAKKKKKKPPKPPPKPTGTGAIPGHKPGVTERYERGRGGTSGAQPGTGSTYVPGHGYGSGTGNQDALAQMRTGAGQIFANNDPRAVWNWHLAGAGLPTDPSYSNFSRHLNDRFDSLLANDFAAARLSNMDLTLDAYLQQLGGGVPEPPAPPKPPKPPPHGPGKQPATNNPPRGKIGPVRRVVDRVRVPANPQAPPNRNPAALPNQNPLANRGGLMTRGGREGNPFLTDRDQFGAPKAPAALKPPGIRKKPKPKQKPVPGIKKGPTTGSAGTEPMRRNYGMIAPGEAEWWRRDFLQHDPLYRGQNAHMFGAGATLWADYRN